MSESQNFPLLPSPSPLPEDDQAKERFEVNSDQLAWWAMRKLREEQKRADAIDVMADAEIDRINQWRDTASAPHFKEVRFFEGHLLHYLRQQREHHGRKTIVLPDGRLVSSGPGTGTFKADPEFVEWAEMNGYTELVKVEKTPLATPTRAMFHTDDDGTITVRGGDGQVISVVPARVVPGEIRYRVEVGD